MWGIIPAAGKGSRIQPLAFSKELLPVGGWQDQGTERPRAVSEYIVERMILGGASKICFVVAPSKSDILEYYGTRELAAEVCFVVQPKPVGLCDAIFRALPVLAADDNVCIGLPDTIWFPADALLALPDGEFTFLTFPVDKPEFFDAVVTDDARRICRIEVKHAKPSSSHIWGAFKMSGITFRKLHDLWLARDRQDEYVGTLVNAYIEGGGAAYEIPAGELYMDIGTLEGYRQAVGSLRSSTGTQPVMKKGIISPIP